MERIHITEISHSSDAVTVDMMMLKQFSVHTNTHVQVIATAEVYLPLTHSCVLFHMRKKGINEVEYLKPDADFKLY